MTLPQVVGFASGAFLLATGIAMLAARPRREGSTFFTLFVMAWGLEITLFNVAGLEIAEGLRGPMFVFALGLILLETVFLVHFIGRFSRREGPLAWSWAAGAGGLVLALLFAWSPDLFLDGLSFTTLGVLAIIVPNFAAFYVVLHLLADRLLEDVSEIEARELGIVFAAVALYASSTAGFQAVQYTVDWTYWADVQGTAATAGLAGLFLAATAFLAVVAVRLRRRARASQGAVAVVLRRAWLAVAVPWVLGVAASGFEVAGGSWLALVEALRVGTGLLIAYGLVKFEIFDLDLKVKQGLRRVTVVGVFVVAFFAVSETVELLISDVAGNWAGLGAAGVVTLGLRPLEARADQLADRVMPGVEDSAAYREEREVEVYQAAVERAAGDEVLTDREREILAGLRADLGLQDEEARRIETRVLETPIAA